MNMTAMITSTELKDTLAQKSGVRVIDVRRKADFENSPETISGAIWQDPENVAEWSKTLPKDQDLVVYCVKGGLVSQSVATALQESHPTVRFLEGGILGWEGTRK
jgi:rhodanese-related sulfurtransferase